MRKAFFSVIFLAALAFGSIEVKAQIGCTVQTETQILNSLADNVGPGAITPQTLRNFVCSIYDYASTGTDYVTVIKTSDYAVQLTDLGKWISNSGATGPVNFTLPTTAAGAAAGFHVCFEVDSPYLVTVTVPVDGLLAQIAIGTSNSSPGGNISSNVPLSTICTHAVLTTPQWASDQEPSGTWNGN